MDKRAILAITLSFIVLLIWQIFIAPKPAPPAGPGAGSGVPDAPLAASKGSIADRSPAPSQPAAPGLGTTPATAAAPSAEATTASAAAGGSVAPGSAGTAAPARREAPEGTPPAIINTDYARIEITSLGGKLDSWTLKKHQDHEGRPYELVSPDSLRSEIYPLQFRLQDKALETLLNRSARFEIERHPVQADEASQASGAGADGIGSAPAEEVRLVYSDGKGLEAVKSFIFRMDSYPIEVSASITKDGRPVGGHIVWGPSIGTPSADDLASRYYYGGRAIVDFGIGATRYYPTKVTAPLALGDGLRWAGLEEQYFAAVFIPADGLSGAEIFPTSVAPPPPVAGSSAKPADTKPLARLCVAVPLGQTYTLFAGPKDYRLLSGMGRDLPELVNFAPGMPLIGTLVGKLAELLWYALRWLYTFLPNYGLGIIILTTVIKIIFYPITQRAMVKMRGEQKKMLKVAPKVNAIKEKFRKSKDAAGRTKMNEEIMALYKREGINPMASLGGCLPLLLQMPILYGFYSVLTVSIELRHSPFFGWIHDLSARDPYYITPIVMGVSMFVQQKLAMTKSEDPQQKAQQRMMLVMPLIFTYTFLHLPSGLVLYWFTNNVLGIVQQVLINRQAQALEAADRAPAAGKA